MDGAATGVGKDATCVQPGSVRGPVAQRVVEELPDIASWVPAINPPLHWQ